MVPTKPSEENFVSLGSLKQEAEYEYCEFIEKPLKL